MLFSIISLLRCAVYKGSFLTFSRRLFVLMKLRPENLAAVAVWLGHISKNHPDVFETA